MSNKELLITLSPKEGYELLAGNLTVLVRKKMPKCKLPIKVNVCIKKDKKMELLKGPALYEREEIKFIAQGGLLSIDDFLNGKVIASFLCNKVGEIYCGASSLESKRTVDWVCNGISSFEKVACLTQEDLDKYLGNVKHSPQGFAIHITNLDIFDKPKELWRFKTPKMAERYKLDLKKAREHDYEIGTRIAEGVANDDECANCVELTEMSEYYYGLQRAPSNFCYVEVENENSKRI